MLIKNLSPKYPLQVSNPILDNKKSDISLGFCGEYLKSSEKVSPMLLRAYSPINFKSANVQELATNLSTFKDVHCPVCGVKMLTKDKFFKLLKEGSEIDDPKEFVNWLDENNEYISDNVKPFINSAKRFSNFTFVTDTSKLFDCMKDQAVFNLNGTINDMKNLIGKFEEHYEFCESDKVLLDECKVRLETLDLSEDFIKNTKEILGDTIKNLEHETKGWMFYQLKNLAVPAGLQVRILNQDKAENKEDRQRKVLKTLFTSSVQNVTKVYSDAADEEKFWGNIILTCANCTKLPLVSLFSNYRMKPELDANYEKYLTDVSRNLLGKEKYKEYLDYPFQSAGLVKHLTKKGLSYKFNSNQILSDIKVANFQFKRNKIDFPIVKHDGVPCSTCGMPTISHEKRKTLFQKILDKNSMLELMYFLDLNYRRLNRDYKAMARFFISEVKKNPEISEAEIYSKLREFTTKDLNNQIEANIDCCDEILAQVTSPEDIECVEKYRKGLIEKFRNLGKDEKFDYYGYKDLLADSIYNLSDSRLRTVYGTRLKESVRKRMRIRLLLFPIKETVEKVGSPIKLWMQDMFKGSVATVDHLVAKNINGDDSFSNFSVMCKICNTEKSNYNMLHWFGLHNKDIVHNMQKYLDFVIFLIKTGREKNVGNYPKEFVENVFHVTRGKIDLSLAKLPQKYISEVKQTPNHKQFGGIETELPDIEDYAVDVDF